ncbi:MAG: aminotransferase DegT, partial [Elusimicrobia bacterium CG11_big_fil_rev_8_21_14_0_20_64_6]
RFADVDESHLGLDPDKLDLWLSANTRVRGGSCRVKATGRRIAACVPMHAFGHPARIDRITKVCRRYAIPVVEDAAESLGSSYRGRAAGAFGAPGCLSFNGNKILTTGGGGMVVGDDAVLTARVKHLSTQAKKDPATYLHDEVGYNYRLPNVNAALGCAQMEQLDGFLAKKRLIAERYRRGLAGAADLALIWEPEGARSNFWLNTVRAATPKRAVQLRERMCAEGFEARPLWTPCHRQPMFEKLATGSLDAGDRAWRTCFNVPSSSDLSLKNVDAICRLLTEK